MTQEQTHTHSTIGIVGGGKVGLQLLQLFTKSELTKLAYVVDKETQAPAMLAAAAERIATFTDLQQALTSMPVDFIFEVTGSDKVVQILRQTLANTATEIVTHEMSFVILKVIDECHHRTTWDVRTDVEDIKRHITDSLTAMGSTIENIKGITGDLRFMALNAQIEAARAGDEGRGFDIVAQQVEKSAETMREMTQEMAQVNTAILSIAERIESSLQRLD